MVGGRNHTRITGTVGIGSADHAEEAAEGGT